LAAEGCEAQGGTERLGREATRRRALKRLAPHWDTSATRAHASCSPLRTKNKWRARLIALAVGHSAWVLGLEAAGGWSRLAQPHRQPWTEAQPRRVSHNAPDRRAPEPQAVAWEGLLRAETPGLLLRCVAGRPGSPVTRQWLGGGTTRWTGAGQQALRRVWDQAAWYVSQAVRAWRQAHQRRVKQDGGCRGVVGPVPLKRPWLHRLEPQWGQGKRASAEPERQVGGDALQHRIWTYDDGELLDAITQ